MLTNFDCADDLVITSDAIASATTLRHHLANAANDVGIYETLKLKFVTFNLR